MELDPDKRFMQEAFKMAVKAYEADEVPVGAVVVHKNTILAKAHNQIEALKDPSAHAEMIAITAAANALGQKWLHQCTMYVTLEPCAMCAGALVLSRIERVVFGAKDPKSGACGSILNLAQHEALNHKFLAISGVLESECAQLLSDFFKTKRTKSAPRIF